MGTLAGYRAALFHAWRDTDRRLVRHDVLDQLRQARGRAGMFGSGQGWPFRLAATLATARSERALAVLRTLAENLRARAPLIPARPTWKASRSTRRSRSSGSSRSLRVLARLAGAAAVARTVRSARRTTRPWDLDQLSPLADHDLTTMRLPDDPDDIEAYADVVADQVAGLDDYVLVGDSFGAVVALAFATRRPSGLRALVLSGGFASDPVDDPVTRAKVAMARFLPGPLYRQIVLRFHAASLSSPHDLDGQVPWTKADSRRLFRDNTPHAAYVNRARAAFSADYRGRLATIDVPTLILTPSHDELIGDTAARIMLDGIPDATERVLDDTGHMFRFSHPITYATAIRDFLATHGLTATPVEARA